MHRSPASLTYRMSPLILTLLLGLTGCTAAVDDPVVEPIDETHSAVQWNSGLTISVSIATNSGSSSGAGVIGSSPNVATFGYALVGGGGGVVGEPVPGALLRDSHPDRNATGQFWDMAIMPHLHPAPFSYQISSIGMKLVGVTADALSSMVTITQATGTASHKSSVTAFAPAGHVVLGGGATAPSISDQTGEEQLLVASIPHSGPTTLDGWTATSKDHEVSYIDSVTAYVISIPRCPPGFTGGCLQSKALGFASSTGGGYRPVSATLISGINGVVTGLGGKAVYAGPGRMLTNMSAQEVVSTNEVNIHADSKDADLADPGGTFVYAVVLNSTPQ